MIAKRFPVKSLTACALLALTLAYPAIAQETVNVDGTEATRVVIAPPQNDLARSIKTGLATAYYGAKDTPAYNAAQKLYYFYGERAFEPLWLTQDASGKLAFSRSFTLANRSRPVVMSHTMHIPRSRASILPLGEKATLPTPMCG